MPMPHRTFAQLAKRRLTGKEGRERIREVSALLAELPDYKNGPYADLRKWLTSEIEESRVRSNAVHRDSIAVRREGAAQIALVGPPNVGKSSILQALSEIQIKTGDYPFTTLRPDPGPHADRRRPRPARRDPGAHRGRQRRPRRGTGAARRPPLGRCDRLLHPRRRRSRGAPAGPAPRSPSRASTSRPSSRRPAPTKPGRAASSASGPRFPDLEVVAVSVLDEASLDAFRDAAWRLTGLIRVHLRTMGETDPEPLALDPGSTSRPSPTGSTTISPRPSRSLGSGVPQPASMASAWAATMRSSTAMSSRSCVSRMSRSTG